MSLDPHPVTGVALPSPVPAGTGWPGDAATVDTRVADTPAAVRRLAAGVDLVELEARISVCRACPRLVRWREQVAVTKRRAYAGQPYWGRPVPGFGDPEPRILMVGLAPGAHGANRTGRNFTGDSSGDWLTAQLHRAGLAERPRSEHAGDGQRLLGVRMVATVRCAPPENKPTPAERDTCAPWLDAELELVRPSLRVVVCLGALGWRAALSALRAPRPWPKFGHGAEVEVEGLTVLGCFHPSPHNRNTGRLTEDGMAMVLARAMALAGR